MRIEPLEVYADDSNLAVVKPPGRRFPGCVMQGDSLSTLCGIAESVAVHVRDRKPIDDEEFVYAVQELQESLLGRLLHYQAVLEKHGIELPYSRARSDAELVRLVSDEAD